MMTRLGYFSVLLLLSALLLSACGQTAPKRNARLELAAEHSQSAQRAFDRGDYQVAARQYEMALQVDVAVENVSGIAIDVLNLSRVYQLLGHAEVADAYLDKLLQDQVLEYETSYLAMAATQKSLLILQRNDVAGAKGWLEKAAAWCGSKCAVSGVIDNARAGIALREQDAGQALHWSERAASANRNTSPLEYGNALRYIGEAKLLQGEPAAALKLAEEALVVDKSLGLPEKIRQDLLLSARACEAQGATELAGRYRERAARIPVR